MKIKAAETLRIQIPLVNPFHTVHSEQSMRELLLLHITTDLGDGWGECSAFPTSGYSQETLDSAQNKIEGLFIPALASCEIGEWREVRDLLVGWEQSPAATHAIETAVADASLTALGRSLADDLGGAQSLIQVGVVVGFESDIEALLGVVAGYVADGYRRVKVKIRPGWDIDPLQALRSAFPSLALQVDANGSYSAADIERLCGLDAIELLMIEQPFPADDLKAHLKLAGVSATPVCLDESITSSTAARRAIEMGACSIVSVKPSMVGGLREAVAIHDLCVDAGVDLWCGGMLESGIGRAAAVALASLPGFTLTADLSATARYFARDITEPFLLEGSSLRVPTGPGLGVHVENGALLEHGAVRRTIDLTAGL